MLNSMSSAAVSENKWAFDGKQAPYMNQGLNNMKTHINDTTSVSLANFQGISGLKHMQNTSVKIKNNWTFDKKKCEKM